MATNEVPRGPISAYVVENVKRLRADRHWSLAELSEQMGRVGRPMLSSGLHRLEQGKRRIDCDDLVALAAAFGVSPIALLLPADGMSEITLTDSLSADARAAWDWMRARRPLAIPEDEDEDFAVISFLRDSLPRTMRDRWPMTAAGLQALQEDRPDAKIRRVPDILYDVERSPDGVG
jgi:transcriptional regulator with XRE-family HTH domain